MAKDESTGTVAYAGYMVGLTEQQFFDEWPEDTPIEWWNEGRRKLNIIIRRYNAWHRQNLLHPDQVNAEEAREIIVDVLQARSTWAKTDGGHGWRKELDLIRQAVRRLVEEPEFGSIAGGDDDG